MDRRTFLLGVLGSLAAAPTIIAAASPVEAASVPEALPPAPQPVPEPASSSGEAEADLPAPHGWLRHPLTDIRQIDGSCAHVRG